MVSVTLILAMTLAFFSGLSKANDKVFEVSLTREVDEEAHRRLYY